MEQEGSNSHDYFATVVKKDGNVVGRVPTELPKIYWNFLARGGRINCEVTGRRKRGKGLEEPCIYKFGGSMKLISKLRIIKVPLYPPLVWSLLSL